MQYFFVLTGFLVSRSVLMQQYSFKNVLKKSINRYFRLLPVIIMATIFAFLTMVFGWQYHHEIAGAVANGSFLDSFCDFVPNFKNLLFNGFIRPFIIGSDYINPLWTIKYEFIGYIMCMVTCWLICKSRWRRLIYVMISAVLTTIDSTYIAFFLGVLCADIFYSSPDKNTVFSKYYQNILESKTFLRAVVILGIIFATVPTYIPGGGIYDRIIVFSVSVYRAIGVTLILHFILRCSNIQKYLSNKLLLWLGNMSYEIYAIHWPIMLVVEARLFSFFSQVFTYDFAALSAFGLTLPVVAVTAYCMKRIPEMKCISKRRK